MGNIYRESKKNTEAINAYQQVIARESPIAAKTLINIAEIYRQQDDFELTPLLSTQSLLRTILRVSLLFKHANNLMRLTRCSRKGNYRSTM